MMQCQYRSINIFILGQLDFIKLHYKAIFIDFRSCFDLIKTIISIITIIHCQYSSIIYCFHIYDI
jgi:hypothetical protein